MRLCVNILFLLAVVFLFPTHAQDEEFSDEESESALEFSNEDSESTTELPGDEAEMVLAPKAREDNEEPQINSEDIEVNDEDYNNWTDFEKYRKRRRQDRLKYLKIKSENPKRRVSNHDDRNREYWLRTDNSEYVEARLHPSVGFFSPTVGWGTSTNSLVRNEFLLGASLGYLLGKTSQTLGPYFLAYDHTTSGASFFGLEYGIWTLGKTPLFSALRIGLSHCSFFGEEWTLNFAPAFILGANIWVHRKTSVSFEGSIHYTMGSAITASSSTVPENDELLFGLHGSVRFWY